MSTTAASKKKKKNKNKTKLNSELHSFIQGRNFATLLHRMVAELL
jgi:hypothetical protein